jgi:uncharacterized membrane protein
MTIEFRCKNCDKLLRTPAGTEGKQAKCPDCGALMEIPAGTAFSPPPREPDFRPSVPESTPQQPDPRPREAQFPPREPGFAPGPAAAAPRESGNPFQSPSLRSMEPQRGPAQRGFHPTQIDLGGTVEQAWQIYKNNLGMLVTGNLVVIGVSIAVGAVLNVIAVATFGTDYFTSQQATPSHALMNVVQQIVSNVIQVFLMLGLMRFTLNICRQEPAAIGDIFSGGQRLLPAIGLYIVVTVAVILGSLLCIVPGIWLALAFGLSWYMLLDQGTGVIDSLRYSWQATRGNKLVLLGLWLMSVGLVILGFLACLVGSLLAVPFALVLFTVAYLQTTGQLGAAMPAYTSAPAPAAPSAMTPPPTFE